MTRMYSLYHSDANLCNRSALKCHVFEEIALSSGVADREHLNDI